jgi:hypothetical protein
VSAIPCILVGNSSNAGTNKVRLSDTNGDGCINRSGLACTRRASLHGWQAPFISGRVGIYNHNTTPGELTFRDRRAAVQFSETGPASRGRALLELHSCLLRPAFPFPVDNNPFGATTCFKEQERIRPCWSRAIFCEPFSVASTIAALLRGGIADHDIQAFGILAFM